MVFQLFLRFALRAPRWLQKVTPKPHGAPKTAQDDPKRAQDRPNMAPRQPEIASRRPKIALMGVQERPKTASQTAPERSQSAAREPLRLQSPQVGSRPSQNKPKMPQRRHNGSPNGRHNSWGNPSRPINVRTQIGGTHSPLSWTTFRSARRPQPLRHKTHSKPICFPTFVASHHSTPLNDEPQQPVQKGRGRR